MGCVCTGDCCEVIVITTATVEVFNGMIVKYVEKGNKDSLFIQKNWIPLSIETAKKLRPTLSEHTDEKLKKYPMFYCKKFNDITRKCMDYKNRPKVCREYPHYNYKGEKLARVINLIKRVNPSCGYVLEFDKNKEVINGTE